MDFDTATVIANDPEVAKRIDARAISNVYKMMAHQKGRNSRELTALIDEIKSKNTDLEGKYNIIIEKTDKEV